MKTTTSGKGERSYPESGELPYKVRLALEVVVYGADNPRVPRRYEDLTASDRQVLRDYRHIYQL